MHCFCGSVQGSSVGTIYTQRTALKAAGVHRTDIAGMHGTVKHGTESVVSTPFAQASACTVLSALKFNLPPGRETSRKMARLSSGKIVICWMAHAFTQTLGDVATHLPCMKLPSDVLNTSIIYCQPHIILSNCHVPRVTNRRKQTKNEHAGCALSQTQKDRNLVHQMVAAILLLGRPASTQKQPA